ncbi:MAG: glucose-6-phosphate dehydrogenase [Candidatus Doudnabacteria bacterium]|nr:glucose-6-phosphate dehydrogenase [Candidatus Doudnabacteria bacterium]
MKNENSPTILAVFGATGDLVSRKLLPAIYHLYRNKQLPNKFKVIGVARRPFSDDEFRKLMKKALVAKIRRPEKLDEFLKLFSYHQGQFDQDATYTSLKKVLNAQDTKWKTRANKLFYLATPPNFYDNLLHKLAGTGLAKQTGKTWARIIVEKPFGKDLDHAEHLDVLLGKLFDESQVYRIDHYLAKEVLQNIMAFRFANNLLEDVWNRKYVEKIEIKLLEEIDVEGRGEFYDGVGALLDVGQNHLLQELALVTMDKPESFRTVDIHARRAEILKNLRLMNAETVKSDTMRAQYTGYTREPGVARNSNTETYFKLETYIDNPRWQDVPIYLEAGKKFPANEKSVTVTFKHPEPCLCPPGVHYQNRVIFRIQPTPGIEIEFWSKKPNSSGMELEKRLLHFNYESDPSTRYLAEYAKLISDSLAGDQTLFVSSREAISSWRFIDPIVKAWKAKLTPLLTYKKDFKILSEFDRRIRPQRPFTKLAMVGLGKMGKSLSLQLLEKGFSLVAANTHSKDAVSELSRHSNFHAYPTDQQMLASLPKPRLVWLMVPHAQVDEVLFGKDGLAKILDRGDIVIDSGNSYFKDTIRRGRLLTRRGIEFMDLGFSGGPGGARRGGCLMIGGKKSLYQKLEHVFASMAADGAYNYFGKIGAGHFVKMVHNGIEYGMMQSLAEGFGILKASPFRLNLIDVADIYNHGSVIESRLVGWLKDGFEMRGQNLKGITGVVGYTGEGEWTAKTAKQLRVPAKIIEESFLFRVKSKKTQSFVSKLVSSMREQFGGHSVRSV